MEAGVDADCLSDSIAKSVSVWVLKVAVQVDSDAGLVFVRGKVWECLLEGGRLVLVDNSQGDVVAVSNECRAGNGEDNRVCSCPSLRWCENCCAFVKSNNNSL